MESSTGFHADRMISVKAEYTDGSVITKYPKIDPLAKSLLRTSSAYPVMSPRGTRRLGCRKMYIGTPP